MTYGMPMGQPYTQPAQQFAGGQPNWQPPAALAQQIQYQGQPGYAQPAAQPYMPQYAANSGQYASRGDRIPAQPDLGKRPTSPMVAQMPKPSPERAPIIRGAAPEEVAQNRPSPQQTASMWKPIRIPSPGELGILTSDRSTGQTPAKTMVLSQETPINRQPTSNTSASISPPATYDLATVMNWLDGQGGRKCQREKLAEGIVIQCVFASAGNQEQIFTVKGTTDEAALRELVRQVSSWRQGQAVAGLR